MKRLNGHILRLALSSGVIYYPPNKGYHFSFKDLEEYQGADYDEAPEAIGLKPGARVTFELKAGRKPNLPKTAVKIRLLK